MPKRPGSLETLQLSHELLRRIPKGRTITAPELHHQLREAGYEREMRTIQRQLETLTAFYDIERDDSSKPYRYRWKESARGLSLPGLSAQESLLLTLAEQQLRNLLPAKLMNSMQGFFRQARGQLDEKGTTQREREWLDKVRVVSTSQPLLPPKIDADVFQQVSDALYGNQWLDVDYKNAEGDRKTSRVMPLGLAQQGPRMYLVCRYEGYDNERCLALHRFVWAKASTLTFERPKDFDLKQFDDAGRFGYGDGTKIRLSFRITKEAGLHVVECPLSLDQQVVELDNVYEITATVVDTDMLDWWLRGFGDAVRHINKIPSA
ncbi:MAG: WYL domain-containing protein [Polaromonas sp.]|uniref:helix-turn-helix transcriptional regulator n=1 Tax=Polaromonas sp. TaxID=1869339 RepID=UPI0027354265|nr:WYL domain-containing protein [Polaromonas sp.]MDP2817872.1 WYL domain-containing protein [Polaromonas sp.]